MNSNFQVDAAPCLANEDLLKNCRTNRLCSYYNQRDKAIKSQAVITNPSFILLAAGDAPNDPDNPWIKREAVIMDECHNLEDALVSYAQTKISPEELFTEHGAKVKNIKFTDDFIHNYEALQELHNALIARAIEYSDKLKTEFPNASSGNLKDWAKGFSDKEGEKIKKLKKKIYAIGSAIKPLSIFFETHKDIDELTERWLLHPNPEDNTLQLSPINANFLFKQYLDHLGEKFVLMSATTGTKSQICKTLGLTEAETCFIEVDTPFPPEKSPIVVMPMLNLTYNKKVESMSKIGGLIDEILNAHASERGIIHSATYAFGGEIYRRVNATNRNRLLFRDMDAIDAGLNGSGKSKYARGYSNIDLLEMHTNRDRGHSVLVSPSMMEGIDLYDDLSQFQIILKMPWASLGDPRIKRKLELDSDWYSNKVCV